MKIIILADDESTLESLDIDKADVLISLGDLSDRSVIKAMQRYKPDRTFIIRGSHDLDHGELPEGAVALHEMVEEYKGVTFGGFNGCWRYKKWGPYLYGQDEASIILEHFPRVDIFAAHSVPAGVHERDQDVYRGLIALRDYALREKPAVMLHGQQHINCRSTLGETEIIGVYGISLLEIADR